MTKKRILAIIVSNYKKCVYRGLIKVTNKMEDLRNELDDVNLKILELINHRASIVQDIGQIKQRQNMKRFDPVRERDMLNKITKQNTGPFMNSTVEHIFKEIFKASLELQKDDHRKALLVSRKKKPDDTVVQIKDVKFGNGSPRFIVGPCAVESYEQVAQVAEAVKNQGLR